MTMTTTQKNDIDAQRRIKLEDELSILLPQYDRLHQMTQEYARGPQPRLLRQLKAVKTKVEKAQRELDRLNERPFDATIDEVERALAASSTPALFEIAGE